MSKFNYFIHLNSYKDSVPNNNPSLNFFKWSRENQGIEADKPQSMEFALAPGESRTLFSGTRGLGHDGTTQYDLSLKAGTTNTYQLKHAAGTAPAFRASRSTGADATTQVTVTKSGSVLTFQSSGGTAFSLISGGVVVGDEVRIGSQFASSNQGKFKILSVTTTSFSVENSSGVAETPITLGAGFADQVRIYGAAGVQIGDKIKIVDDFSPASRDTYEITDVQDNLVEFYSSKSLPQETAVTTTEFVIYSSAKKFIYLESDKRVAITVNGVSESDIEPFIEPSGIKPGAMMKSSTVWSLTVQNNGLDIAILYAASIE